MTVYVDDMHQYHIGRFGRMKMSHMIADTEAELHAMAAKIGVARRWYQGDHYDIALSKRALAVAAGAVEITYPQAGAMMAIARMFKLPMGDPQTALERRTELRERSRSTTVAIPERYVKAAANLARSKFPK